MELISIGQFAQVGCVSHRTLHLYEQKGLLEPAYINPETGYRYYSYDQYATLGGIVQLKAAGFGLDEIQQIFQEGNIEALRERLAEKRRIVREKEREVAVAKMLVEELDAVCASLQSDPLCGRVMLEMLQPREVVFLDPPRADDSSEPSRSYAESLGFTRHALDELGLPSGLAVGRGGGIITVESVLEGNPVYTKSYFPITSSMGIPADRIGIIPGGPHLTMLVNYRAEDATDRGLLEAEIEGLHRLLEHAEAEGFVIADNFFDEAIAGTPAFGYSDNECFFKLCLPVKSLT